MNVCQINHFLWFPGGRPVFTDHLIPSLSNQPFIKSGAAEQIHTMAGEQREDQEPNLRRKNILMIKYCLC